MVLLLVLAEQSEKNYRLFSNELVPKDRVD